VIAAMLDLLVERQDRIGLGGVVRGSARYVLCVANELVSNSDSV
jgi:hypothetical protein